MAPAAAASSSSPSRSPSPPPSPEQACCEDGPLERTQSQVVKRLKVDEVARALEERGGPVEELRRALSRISTQPAGAEDQSSRYEQAAEQLQQVDRLQQGFRNFGEDLMEGMLALDGLSGLAEEDRAARKETLRGIQGLLDDIDSAKPRVAQLRRKLAAELDQLKPPAPTAAAQATEPEATPEPAALAEEALPAMAEQSDVDMAEPTPLAAERQPPATGPKVMVDWARVRLPVEFSVAERGREYVLSAHLPGLEARSIRLTRGSGGSSLSVQALRLPSPAEQEALECSVAARLERLPRKQRQRLQQEDVDELAARLGRGHFGLLRQEYEVPRDVDWRGVECSYEGDVLRVVLPRVVAPAPRGFGGYAVPSHYRGGPRSHRYPGGLPGATHLGGLPGFAW